MAKTTKLVTLKPTVKPPYCEHRLDLNQHIDGTIQLCLTEKGEDFPQAFISLNRTQREKLIAALQKTL